MIGAVVSKRLAIAAQKVASSKITRSTVALGVLAGAVALNCAQNDAASTKPKAKELHFEAHETITPRPAVTNINSDEDPFAAARPDPKEWVRMDEVVLNSEQFKPFISKNAFHDTLVGEGMLEKHEIYTRRPSKKTAVTANQPPRSSTDPTAAKESDPTNYQEIIALMQYGDALNGHPGVVHGGVLAMTFDNLFGWVFFAAKLKAGFTANLNVNFRKPVFAGSVVVVNSKLVEIADRKRYLQATMTDSKDGSVVAEATALFILPKPSKPSATPNSSAEATKSPKGEKAPTAAAVSGSGEAAKKQ